MGTNNTKTPKFPKTKSYKEYLVEASLRDNAYKCYANRKKDVEKIIIRDTE